MIPELKVIEGKKYQEELTLKVPEKWWISSSSYPMLNEKDSQNESLKIIPFKEIKREKLTLPKPSYWDISQGDYMVHEDYSSIYRNIQVKKKLFLISIYLFLIGGSTLIYFLS